MQHSFDIDIAKEYGIAEAIILNNLEFWIKKNEANDINYHDGEYWTFNSVKAFNEMFPYLSQRQIQNALKRLREKGIIQVGNYNQSLYDRTLWYAFTEKGKCIMQKCKMEDVKKENGLCENVEPIPYINTDKNTNINTDNIDNQRLSCQQVVDLYNSTCVSYPKVTAVSERRKQAIKARQRQYSDEDFKRLFELAEQISFLKGKNDRDWSANFDWLMKDANMAKVLDGNYADKKSPLADEYGLKPGESLTDRIMRQNMERWESGEV